MQPVPDLAVGHILQVGGKGYAPGPEDFLDGVAGYATHKQQVFFHTALRNLRASFIAADA
jgi:hypothetical protein